MEPSNHPERAIPSAALLASLAPTSGHMVHMPGHIYYRVGDYASADHWFAASTEADERYMREQHVSVDDDWNYVHNMMYAHRQPDGAGPARRRQRALRPSGWRARPALRLALHLERARSRSPASAGACRLRCASATGPPCSPCSTTPIFPTTTRPPTCASCATNCAALPPACRPSTAAILPRRRLPPPQMDAGLWRQSQDAQAAAAAKAKADADKQNLAATATKPDAAAAAAHDASQSRCRRGPDRQHDERCIHGTARGRASARPKNRRREEAVTTRRCWQRRRLGYHEPPFYIRPVAETEAEALLRAKDYVEAQIGLSDRAQGAARFRLRTVRHRARG